VVTSKHFGIKESFRCAWTFQPVRRPGNNRGQPGGLRRGETIPAARYLAGGGAATVMP
jgi:hypothetical protein